MPGNNVIQLPSLVERGHHNSGVAVCLQCRHKWTAVAPVGVFEFECPECHTHKGVFEYPCEPESAWICNCGCHLFIISSTTNLICYKCGAIPGGFIEY